MRRRVIVHAWLVWFAMFTMLVCGLVVGFSLGHAKAEPYSDADMQFVSSLGTIGYYDEDTDRLIKTGHIVCQLLDQGASEATVDAEIIIHHGGGDYGDPSFAATIFTQYAAIAYCPWQPIANANI